MPPTKRKNPDAPTTFIDKLAGPPHKGQPKAKHGRAGDHSVAEAEYEAAEAATLGEVIEADYLVAPGATIRGRIAEWVQLRAAEPDITNIEIARRMGISVRTLNTYIHKASTEGWLKFEDALSRMEFQLIPKVLDNLDRMLEAGDKTATIETAKGTIFKTYQASQGIQDASQTVLAIKIEMPTPGSAPTVMVGQIIGTPRENDDTQS